LTQKRNPRVRLFRDATYVVVGGVGGIGKSLVRRLLDIGAKHVVLLSRNAESSLHKTFIAEVAATGVIVKAVDTDVSDAAALDGAVRDITGLLPPVKGVIQAAMVLQVRKVRS
jgi:NAD(P)-dependent dehydrogenase (short-subunit alcohol dehydrogenase family)